MRAPSDAEEPRWLSRARCCAACTCAAAWGPHTSGVSGAAGVRRQHSKMRNSAALAARALATL